MIDMNISFMVVLHLPNDKLFDWFRLKAFADDNINLNEKFKFRLGRVENIVGKRENAGF